MGSDLGILYSATSVAASLGAEECLVTPSFGSEHPGLCCLLVQCARKQTIAAAQSLRFNAEGFVQETRRVRMLGERVQKEGVRTSLTHW